MQVIRVAILFIGNDFKYVFLGSASIHLHVMSPKSNKLFRKAIMMSGTALNPWLPRETDHLSIAYNLGEN